MKLLEDRELEKQTPGAIAKQIDGMSYVEFVSHLGVNANDENLRAAIASGLEDGDQEDDVFTFSREVKVAVRGCKPTQSEILLGKSLSYQLPDVLPNGKTNDKHSMTELMSSNSESTSYTVKGPIVIFNDGSTNYVIDGHHRWSQVHVVNPDAFITSIVMRAKKAISATSIATEILKAVQLSILKVVQDKSASGRAKLPFTPDESDKLSPDESQNLFNCSEDDLKNYVIKKTGASFLEVAVKTGKITEPKAEAAADYIWKNVLDLRKNSSPITGATKRELMPQTDGGKNGVDPEAVDALKNNVWIKELETGVINHTEPYESQKWIKTFEQYRRANK